MKEISRKDGSRYFVVNVLGHENVFEITKETNENEAKQVFAKIESNDENMLKSIARMHTSKLPITVDGISLVNGSQNLHEAVRIYEHLSKSDNQNIAEFYQKALDSIKEKYASSLCDKYYYLKVGENFVYTDRGKIYPMTIKDYKDYTQFIRTLKGLEKKSAISQYNMGVRLLDIDIEEAIVYFKQSAEQGDIYAQHNLGCIMERKGNIEEARKWLNLVDKQRSSKKEERTASDNIQVENEK